MSFDSIPIWVIFAGSIAIIMAAIEVGHRLGKMVRQRSEYEKEPPVSAAAAAILGLSAFMLTFAFGVVWNRYDAKRALVREDAVAIRTAWQRSAFLPEGQRAEAAEMFRRYIELRITFAQGSSLDPELVQSVIAETEDLQTKLWNIAVENARADVSSTVAALYVSSLNTMNGVNSTRVAIGIQARVPLEIWLALYCITIFGMLTVGYRTSIAESKRSVVWPLLALSFGLAFGSIASLDRPDSGVVKVSQQPLIDLQNVMLRTSQ
jgi:hypothetical protein